MISVDIVTTTSATAATFETSLAQCQSLSACRPQRSCSQTPVPLSLSNSYVVDSDASVTIPKPAIAKRTMSYPVHTSLDVLRHRVRIQYQDEALRERSLENVKQLLQCAAHSTDASSRTNSEILARKALKYRKVFERMHGVDVHDPTFDASAFLGVEWCKSPTPSPTRRSASTAA